MKIIQHLSEFPKKGKPIVLTVGNFDGMHLGHQAVISALKEFAQEMDLETAVLTFSNPPSSVLSPQQPILQICSLPHKIHLFEQAKINWLILLPFTAEFANQTAEHFLKQLRESIFFTHLILGNDAVMGKDRKGDPESIRALGKMLHFTTTYLPLYCKGELKVSSSSIRNLIIHGKFEDAEQLLGRKYSIYGKVQTGLGKGKHLGFPTANFDVKGMCLPPYGVYAVKLLNRGKIYPGVANLGVSPTIRSGSEPILEVHLFDASVDDFYGTYCEVIFLSFLRPEKKFSTIEDLKKQINQDIQKAKILTQN